MYGPLEVFVNVTVKLISSPESRPQRAAAAESHWETPWSKVEVGDARDQEWRTSFPSPLNVHARYTYNKNL